jgi:hypothetical protein
MNSNFDLNAAIENWRCELVAQPQLTADDRRELEKHLADSMAELRQRGLNDEESFWLARRRIGQPQQLAEEFEKADPAKVWRERLFWLAVGLLVMRLWSFGPVFFANGIITSIIRNNFFLPDWVLFYLPFQPGGALKYMLTHPILDTLFNFLPLFCLVALFVRGYMNRQVSVLHFLFKSRGRFLATATVSLAVYYVSATFESMRYFPKVSLNYIVQIGLANAMISMMLVVLIVWLMPSQNLKR